MADGSLFSAGGEEKLELDRHASEGIWRLPGEEALVKGGALDNPLGRQRESEATFPFLAQYSPAVARDRAPKSRVLKRQSTSTSALEERMQKSLEQFSETCDSLTAQHDAPAQGRTPSQLFLGATSHAYKKHLQPGQLSDHWSTASNIGSPASTSLQIMDQSGTTTQVYDIMSTSRMELTMIRDISMTPTASQAHFDLSQMNVDLTMLDEPPTELGEKLYFAFHDDFVSMTEIDTLELLDSYQKTCSEYATSLRELIDRGVIPSQAHRAVFQWLASAQREKCTWQLVHELYSDRLATERTAEPMDNSSMVTTSEKDAEAKLFQSDKGYRETKIIHRWLESLAAGGLPSCPLQVKYVSDSLRWENTLEAVKHATTHHHGNLITKLDPDAPTREQKQLHEIDKQDDQTLTKYLFMCIRAGDIEKARSLCIEFGQPWRAASLSGGQLYHDPNFNQKEIGDVLIMPEGNKFRDIWKATAWDMASEPGYDMYERATYAALSGNLKHLLPACSSWYDHLWGHLTVLLDVKREQELRSAVYRGRQVLTEMPAEYWDQHMSLEGIFNELKSSHLEAVRQQSVDPYHVAQKYIVLDDLKGLVSEFHSWLNTPLVSPPLLRFMVHVVQFIRSLGVVMDEKQYTDITKEFVDFLVSEHQTYYMLVAVYTATLPPDLQVTCYANLLKRVTEQHMQEDCLQRGARAGLDILACTSKVVEDVCCRDSVVIEPSTSALNLEVTAEDRRKIHVLSWLYFEERQCIEAVMQTNRLMREFLIMRKHGAAERVFNHLARERVAQAYQRGDEDTEVQNAVHEYMAFEAYMDAHNAHKKWFQGFHRETAPPSKPKSGSYTDKLKYDQQMAQYRKEHAKWLRDTQTQSEETVDKLYKVLLFSPRGWMVDQFPNGSDVGGARRTEEMRWLRRLYLPHICFLIHSVHHAIEDNVKSLKLADVIADEKYQLYKEFNQSDLEELLRLLSNSSVALLDRGSHGLG